MPISLKTQKMLWGRAANRCAICRKELVMDATETDDESLVGEACHIVAQSLDGPRGASTLTSEQRDKYANIILLCNIHHKQIDDQFNAYPVPKLEELKEQHESWIRAQLSFDSQKQKEDEVMAGYVEEWVRRLCLDDWKAWASEIMCYGLPTLDHARKVELEDIRQWLLSRVWPSRYPELVAAFANFRLVTQDFCRVFNEHSEKQGDVWRTRKFYQLDANWSEERERRLLRQFDAHVGLVQDLMAELTRAVNYVCDEVRLHLLPAFRLTEGVLLLEGGPYSSFEFRIYRLEYSQPERIEEPYPGLAEFKSARFSRSLHFGHEGEDA
ncbi:HNH endonuclease [Delftia tsuruhatensis]|uniref:HNH endonuclease n=1 Tax=Delftia tsuruhatensis TaxID=180282 RepID=UPI0030D56684